MPMPAAFASACRRLCSSCVMRTVTRADHFSFSGLHGRPIFLRAFFAMPTVYFRAARKSSASLFFLIRATETSLGLRPKRRQPFA